MFEFNPALDFKLLLAVPLIPLIGYIVNICFGRKLPRGGDFLLTGGMGVVMLITVFLFLKSVVAAYAGEEFFHHSSEAGLTYDWLYNSFQSLGLTPNLTIGILYDPLGAAMLMVVGVVSFCVHLFSIGYMHGDHRYYIFFSNISLFTFAMLALVLSDNILFLFIFWEIMGLMSYLLIGHFAHDPSTPYFHRWATWASKKAFMTTRVGDCCLLIGMLMFYEQFHTFRFTELWEQARLTVEANGGEYPAWMTIAGLFTFGGTVGKSAQFPLHIWLPDAMAGPTPVSAMIHAATMVAAGVFLLGRTFPLMSPDVLAVVTVIGGITALFAATIGMTAFDLKAVLAWSTISQLGFMVTAVGLGSVTAGMFHMVTHAFFKACLFLSAGAVIHGCHHEQDMRKMGGLRKHMPVTFWCMLICTLAIAGVPFFSGFYSKDMIIKAAYMGILGDHFDGWKVFALVSLALAATMTAFYMFRLIFMTFYGEYRGEVTDGHHGHDDHGHDDHHAIVHAEDGGIAHGHGGPIPHEVPLPMKTALIILAVLGMLGGHFWLLDSHFYAFWHAEPWFEKAVSYTSLYGREVGHWVETNILGADAAHAEHLGHVAHTRAVWSSMVIAPLGIFLAWFLYRKRTDLPGKITKSLGLVYEAARDRYYIDPLVNATVIRGSVVFAKFLKGVDEKVVDRCVLGMAALHKAWGFGWAWFDKMVVDGLVNGVATVSQSLGAAVRLVQTGRIQQYATFAVGGGLLVAAWLILA